MCVCVCVCVRACVRACTHILRRGGIAVSMSARHAVGREFARRPICCNF